MNQTQPLRFAILNGQLLERGAVAVSPFGDGFMFGCGVFETLKVTAGRPELCEDHWRRLQQGASELGLAADLNFADLRSHCDELIRAEGVIDAVLKVVVFQDEGRVSELILLREYVYTEEHFARGFSLKVIPDRSNRGGIGRLKTQNYLGNLLALREARDAGFDEVVFVDGQGRVLEGATANIFAVRNDVLYTPSLTHGVLSGVIRGRLLNIPDLPARERMLSLDDLKSADEVFLTNSVFHVMPVREIDGRVFTEFERAARCRALIAGL
jgi:branched-subunit amino acid aminotransferase/4-amino-4-deoxychorismate lyase